MLSIRVMVLSERVEFAQRVIDENIIWVGPHPKAIEVMG